MPMELALQALKTLNTVVGRWGAVRMSFLVGSRGVEMGEGGVVFLYDEV